MDILAVIGARLHIKSVHVRDDENSRVVNLPTQQDPAIHCQNFRVTVLEKSEKQAQTYA